MHQFPQIVARLKRAQGHLTRVIAMLEADRPCMEETSAAVPHEVRDMIREFQGVTTYL